MNTERETTTLPVGEALKVAHVVLQGLANLGKLHRKVLKGMWGLYDDARVIPLDNVAVAVGVTKERLKELEGLAIQQLAIQINPDAVLRPLAFLALSTRAHGVVRRALGGCWGDEEKITVGQVAMLTPDRLRSQKNCGPVTFNEIIGALRAHGLCLDDECASGGADPRG